jgi:hypothetical protein
MMQQIVFKGTKSERIAETKIIIKIKHNFINKLK